MKREQGERTRPAFVPEGTVVGGWRVVGFGGSGVYGAVYRAVRVEAEEGSGAVVALKVALLPRDKRFEREAELLRRLRHASIPRQWESGEWEHPTGTRHPYVVMEWVEGEPLYQWGRRPGVTSQQVLRVLGQLASALEAVHGQGAVHRDMKGGNVVVRNSDGRAMLLDFGSGWLPESEVLTPREMVPGTPAYHSPEAALFPLRHGREPEARYVAGPGDDVYALGVTGYRLVTGEYPELGEPFKDEAGQWQPGALGSRRARERNPRVEERLDRLIHRMLSERVERRGRAGELARELEQAARTPEAASTRSLFAAEGEKRAVSVPEPEQRRARSGGWKGGLRREWRWVVGAAVAVVLVSWGGRELWRKREPHASAQRGQASSSRREDGGTSGLGEAASTVLVEEPLVPSEQELLTEGILPEPLPGQARPDSNGRCPRKRQIVLNGGCWRRLKLDRDECEDLSGHLLNEGCYVPVFQPAAVPTSNPVHK